MRVPRPLIERALEILENDAKKGIIPRLILEAPTGYGKSVAAPLFANILIRNELSHNFIHSLPLRAIVRDLYLCLLVNSLTYETELRKKCRKNEEILRKVAEALKSAGIGIDQIAYQMGETLHTESTGSEVLRKEPLFNTRYVVTTLDSLAYNAFRIPVTEVFNPRKHYATPRLRIYLSTLYFDEAHMIYEEEEEQEKSVTAFEELLEMSIAGNIPVIIASATLSKEVEEKIAEKLGEIRVVKLGREDKTESNRKTYVRDDDFEDFIRSIKWETEFIDEYELINKAKEFLENNLRVFIARDIICSAIDTYRNLKKTLDLGSDEIILLHSLMTKEDKEEALNKLYDGKTKILVATSIVEAGVDVSFDILITDCRRPTSVVQRAGRVCRSPHTCRSSEALVYIIRNQNSSNEVIEFIKHVKNEGKEVCWRLPYDIGNYVSYIRLLDQTEKHIKTDLELRRKLKALTNPLLVSSKTINRVLEEYAYSIIRTHLVEILTEEPTAMQHEFKETELDAKTIVTSINKLSLLVKKKCIDSLQAVLDNNETRKIPLDLNEPREHKSLEKTLIKKYVNTLTELMRNPLLKHRVLKIAYPLKTECYIKNEGVKRDVLCFQEQK